MRLKRRLCWWLVMDVWNKGRHPHGSLVSHLSALPSLVRHLLPRMSRPLSTSRGPSKTRHLVSASSANPGRYPKAALWPDAPGWPPRAGRRQSCRRLVRRDVGLEPHRATRSWRRNETPVFLQPYQIGSTVCMSCRIQLVIGRPRKRGHSLTSAVLPATLRETTLRKVHGGRAHGGRTHGGRAS